MKYFTVSWNPGTTTITKDTTFVASWTKRTYTVVCVDQDVGVGSYPQCKIGIQGGGSVEYLRYQGNQLFGVLIPTNDWNGLPKNSKFDLKFTDNSEVFEAYK